MSINYTTCGPCLQGFPRETGRPRVFKTGMRWEFFWRGGRFGWAACGGFVSPMSTLEMRPTNRNLRPGRRRQPGNGNPTQRFGGGKGTSLSA